MGNKWGLIVDINVHFQSVERVVSQYQPRPAQQQESFHAAFNAPTPASALVLIVDDTEADRFFVIRAFAASGVKNPVHILSSGAELIEYLTGQGKFQNRNLYPLPRIILLDLQMPPPNGFEILSWRSLRPELDRILWVAMSQFNSVRSINEAYAAGASTFLAKPLHGDDIKNLVEAFEDYWMVTQRA